MKNKQKIVDEVEGLARKFHSVYQEEAKRQGDVRHKDDYDELPENIKEFDKVLARWVLKNFKAKADLREMLDEFCERGINIIFLWTAGYDYSTFRRETKQKVDHFLEELERGLKGKREELRSKMEEK